MTITIGLVSESCSIKLATLKKLTVAIAKPGVDVIYNQEQEGQQVLRTLRVQIMKAYCDHLNCFLTELGVVRVADLGSGGLVGRV